jgi:asparagine synthase (glutamine-hydrolysing)
MCGIAGKVDPHRAIDRGLVDRMCDVVTHRGPDSRGVHEEPGVALGIQRLSVIDLETGDQPIYNEDGSLAVTLNGEIYNYRELRSELEAAGHRFATNGDTEVIVHLYEEHGSRCVEHLRGMFAFALWDRTKRRLLLARDRLGKKPLFYAHRDGALWFASEPKSILQDPEVPREVDLEAVDAFLEGMYVPDPMCAFQGIRKLPPAHTLEWFAGRVEVNRYWRLDFTPKLHVSEHELHELVRSKLLEATRIRLRSDVPLGAFLSGGIDSSGVVAAMVRESRQPVRTFSVGFDVASFDETRHARRVAEVLGTEHHELAVEPKALEALPRLVWHYGEPFADPSALPSFHLAEAARRHVTVALNGDGGDETFAGYRRYAANAFAARLRGVPAPVSRSVAALLSSGGAGGRDDSTRARVARIARGLSEAPWDRYARYMSSFAPDDLGALYTPELAALVPGRGGLGRRIERAWSATDADHVVDRLLAVDVETFLPGDLLVKMDIASMAHSLEVRSPLLDHELMELAARMPAAAKLRGQNTKRVFKDALRAWLPGDVLDRPKMGFGVPLAAWLRGPLRRLPEDVLLDDRARQRGWFREAEVRRLIGEHQAGRRDHSNRLWALVQLELWLRTFIDASTPSAPTLSVA